MRNLKPLPWFQFLFLCGDLRVIWEKCLASILKQTYPCHLTEIVFVEENLASETRKIIRAFVKQNPGFRIRRSTKPQPSSIKKKSTSNDNEIVITIDPDATLAENFIEKIVANMSKDNATCVGGRVVYQGQSYFQQAVATLLGSKIVFPTGTQDEFEEKDRSEGILHAGYSRHALNEIGMLDRELSDNQYEVAMRLNQRGHCFRVSPDVVSYLPAHTSFLYLFGITTWHGLAWANRLKKQPSSFAWRYAVAPSMLFLNFLFAISFVFYPSVNAALALTIAGYLIFNVFVSASISRNGNWKYLPVVPVLVAFFHSVFSLGVFVGLIASKKWGSALPKWIEKLATITSDYITINAAFFIWAYLRSEMGLYSLNQPEILFFISNIIVVFWVLFFLFFGLYRSWSAASRVEEALSVFKIVGLGVLVIFLITFELEQDFTGPIPMSRMLLVSYWLLMASTVTIGRMALRFTQRRLLRKGIGLQRSIIVGWGKKARNLYEEISKYPALGYQVIGFVDFAEDSNGQHQYQGIPVLGSIDRLKEIIARHEVENVLIALQKKSQSALVKIIAQTDGLPISLKIVPDLYSIITGQARTSQLIGFPLVEILPQYMPTWEHAAKRLMDIMVSLVILIVGFPLWLLIGIIIRIDSPGPVFYRQVRVGKNGRHFTIYKFRSMVADAEKSTGPKWADKQDPRITGIGRFIRKWRIDEVPQFINVLRGEMSVVGPRPERPFFVEKLNAEIPLYSRRLKVKPGITGWAQVKGAYDSSIDDVKQKLQYDLFYLENLSLKMDLKIFLHTVYVMIAGRGQ